MGMCNVEVIKRVGKYLNIPVGATCYNSDKILTTVLEKQNIEGFASIILYLSSKSGEKLTEQQRLLSYQWLEYLAMYADQAANNATVLRFFLQGLNRALEKNSYLTGEFLTITDIAAYHVLYSLLEKLSISERESLMSLCRWFRHIQSQPKASLGRDTLNMETLYLAITAPAVH